MRFLRDLDRAIKPKVKHELQLIAKTFPHSNESDSSATERLHLGRYMFAQAQMQSQQNHVAQVLLLVPSSWPRRGKIFEPHSDRMRQFFGLDACLEGLAMITRQLFDIELKEVPIDPSERWHIDVRKLELRDRASNQLQGIIYLGTRHSRLTSRATECLICASGWQISSIDQTNQEHAHSRSIIPSSSRSHSSTLRNPTKPTSLAPW